MLNELGFRVHFFWYPVGGSKYILSFFSTVAYRLEHKQWGSRFPAIMKELYSGKMEPEYIDEAIAELTTIQEELKRFPPEQAIWNFEDLTEPPNFGEHANKNATDLSNFFLNCDGRDFFTVLFLALNDAKFFRDDRSINAPVRIARFSEKFNDAEA